jgi:8-oxo-dGTP diphosphatase
MLLVVAGALVDGSGRLLVQQRPEGGDHAGLWEFPGGKIETGETAEASLARELAEELAITANPAAMRPLGFASIPGKCAPALLLLFHVPQWTGDPHANHASEIRWVEPDELLTLPMPQADIDLIPQLAPLVKSLSGTTG